MPYIVRCTNLSDEAEAADVRNFFNGLTIPVGNEHIIGGREGVVYVGFSTLACQQAAILYSGRTLCGRKLTVRESNENELREHMQRVANGEDSDHEGSSGADSYENVKQFEVCCRIFRLIVISCIRSTASNTN